ncbi:MAG: HNH endonuclease [Bacteroidales bacterium]|nr:HNH endonuclease [Bacteroidales bacterium]
MKASTNNGPVHEGIYKILPLTQGEVAIVDSEDYERLHKLKWFTKRYKGTCYAAHNNKRGSNLTLMHRYILDPENICGLDIDHINGNGLDNRKKNLRLVTKRQNGQNQKNRVCKTSKFPGVSKVKGLKKCWFARICINKKVKYLGHFYTEESAFEAYKKAVNEIGELIPSINTRGYA